MPTAITPDLPGVAAAFNAAAARYVVIGGFAVAALQFVRATDDSDLLVPDDEENDQNVLAALKALNARLNDGQPVTPANISSDHVRVFSDRHGIVDLLKEGAPPLDFESVHRDSRVAEVSGVPVRFAGLASVVAFKRLAGRPRDRRDIEELEEIHGPLPILPVPGVDS